MALTPFRTSFSALLLVSLFSCNKNNAEEEVIDPGLGQLLEIKSSVGLSAVFEHNDNQMISYFTPKGQAQPHFYIYYNDRKQVSHVVCSVWYTSWTSRSAIFSYDKNKKPVRVNYSVGTTSKAVADPFFKSLAPENLILNYDSLAYDELQRLTGVYKFRNEPDNDMHLYNKVIFYYDSTTSDFPNKLVGFNRYGTSEIRWDGEISISTNGVAAPYRSLWFYTFLTSLDENTQPLPILVDKPATYLDNYLSLVSKCINNYDLKAATATNNYTPYYPYNCVFNSDSTIFSIINPAWSFDKAIYYFKR